MGVLFNSSMLLVMRVIEWGLPGGVPCRPACVETYEAKSLQLTLTACCLAPTVLNIWSYLRLPDVCYPVADLPCRNGSLTRWNYRPCSAAHPYFFTGFYNGSLVIQLSYKPAHSLPLQTDHLDVFWCMGQWD